MKFTSIVSVNGNKTVYMQFVGIVISKLMVYLSIKNPRWPPTKDIA
jgi:hypothetical protein